MFVDDCVANKISGELGAQFCLFDAETAYLRTLNLVYKT